MEGSSSEDHHDEDDKQAADKETKEQQQDEMGESSYEPARQQADDGDEVVLELLDITRICKGDNKKERREKYRLCFERNNVCMVSAHRLEQ